MTLRSFTTYGCCHPCFTVSLSRKRKKHPLPPPSIFLPLICLGELLYFADWTDLHTHTQPITQINKKIHLLPNTKKLKHTKRHKYSNNKKSKILSYENIIWKEYDISDFNDFPTLKNSGLNSCGLIQILRLQLSLA